MPKETPKRFSLYALCGNKPGKAYKESEYLAICEETTLKSQNKCSIDLPDGYVYHGGSKEEIKAIRKLLSHNCFLHLRGQCARLPCSYAGKERFYYPGFVLYTNTRKIVFVEIKQIAMMNGKDAQRKYAALKRYCKAHGFLYPMCDKSLRSYESLKGERLNGKAEKAIDESLKTKGRFKAEDYKANRGEEPKGNQRHPQKNRAICRLWKRGSQASRRPHLRHGEFPDHQKEGEKTK